MSSNHEQITLLIKNENLHAVYLKTFVRVNDFYHYNEFTKAIAPDFFLHYGSGELTVETKLLESLPDILNVRSKYISDFINEVVTVNDVDSTINIVDRDKVNHLIKYYLTTFRVGFPQTRFMPVLSTNDGELPSYLFDFLNNYMCFRTENSAHSVIDEMELRANVIGMESTLCMSSVFANNLKEIKGFLELLNHGRKEGEVLEVYVGGSPISKSLFNAFNTSGTIFSHLI
ncbi:hypothetical protein [Photobacterium leiognathi]|uniref:hypothetical protein n=1 Tax=Photobacterium leiognathi TaxID=553611 RepID=UPI00298198CC|nr:hypothetical protein [Photobacterium leiognathi]